MSSPKKKNMLYKEFVCKNHGKFAEKYPFLSRQQIQFKLKQSWKRSGQGKTKRTVKASQSPKSRTFSHQINSGLERDEESNNGSQSSGNVSESFSSGTLTSLSDSGGWYDEGMNDTANSERNSESVGEEQKPHPSTNALTEETIKGIREHTLATESTRRLKSADTEGEHVVSGLFSSLSPTEGNRESKVQESRLLASKEKEGESNFTLMFDKEDDIFL